MGWFLIGIFLGLILGFLFGTLSINDYWKNKLIDYSFAEYYLNDINERQWRILTISEVINYYNK